MVEGADGLDAVVAEAVDPQFGGEEVEVEQGADVFFLFGVAQGFGVEPADEELEGEVVGVGQAEGLGAFVFGVEDGGEEGGVAAQEFFVQDPVGVFGADVDVDEGVGEESVRGGELVLWDIDGKVFEGVEQGWRTH